MNEHQPDPHIHASLGQLEPHAGMLKAPCPSKLLYKMMTIENLLRSIQGSYLYFNRVDHYVDFPGADPNDSGQLPRDRTGNEAARFEKAPNFSAADHYARARTRTYVCCLSMENSDHLWRHYANGSDKGKACVVFQFGKLREMLNQTLASGRAAVLYNGTRCRQIFSLNYGIVEYVDWDVHQANAAHLPNPLSYTYLKGAAFSPEKEFRISLSALGVGHFALNDGSLMEFPPGLQMELDFGAALASGAVSKILLSPECDAAFLEAELGKFGIAPATGSDPP